MKPITTQPASLMDENARCKKDRLEAKHEKHEKQERAGQVLPIVPDRNDDVFTTDQKGGRKMHVLATGSTNQSLRSSIPSLPNTHRASSSRISRKPRAISEPPRQSWKQRERQRKTAEFQNILSKTAPTTAPISPRNSSLTPPRLGATPSHIRAGVVEGQRRLRTSPAAQQPYLFKANPTVSLEGPAMQKQQRRQTTSMAFHKYPRTRGPGIARPAHTFHEPRHPRNRLQLRITVSRVPAQWTTWDMYRTLKSFGDISRIDIIHPGTLTKSVRVCFEPTPQDISWVGRRLSVPGPDGKPVQLDTVDTSSSIQEMRSTSDPSRMLPEHMSISLLQVHFGIMKGDNEMMVMQSTQTTQSGRVSFAMDLQEKALFVNFPVTTSNAARERYFRCRINLAQIRSAHLTERLDQSMQLTITVEHPPIVFRKTSDVRATFDSGSTLWDERQTWYRQTDIDHNPSLRIRAVQLRNDECIIDLGRWMTYSLEFTNQTAESQAFQDVQLALQDHNVTITKQTISFAFEHFAKPSEIWSWSDVPKADLAASNHSSLADLLEMDDGIHLPFTTKYQLEVCLSNNVLHEVNIDKDFLRSLASMDQVQAVKILEKIVESGERYYNPSEILRLQNKVVTFAKPLAAHLTKIPSAIITPTTIYFTTPVPETSNRVIRKYNQYEDRFLRVKFTDERYKGGLLARDDRVHDELFSRVSRAMTHGINVGGRHYEFLAFGSSQFREHGAYFFSPTSDLDANKIRRWMGNFTQIKVTAKYCSRLGQCFTTTRAIPGIPQVKKIPDINRNGFCFTDGVGKISPFLARMIAYHLGLHSSEEDSPSMFQFRMAGCKGVLAIDPALKGKTIQIRPSQEKFPAKFYGLEICRYSRYQAPTLNQQLILVLSALGIADEIFVRKAKDTMRDLDLAMVDANKAHELLQKRTDFNGITTELSSMILDGFMDAREPFLASCMNLWRAWSLKKLKEKAHIPVTQGAFVLGGTDETQSLKGHFDLTETLKPGVNNAQNASKKDESNLPEIFLQIKDSAGSSNYTVITGICILARNPSLHPGDVRVVRAVDVPALHHMKDCVMLPQTGDRDLANMCSGGDLDGDDYVIVWDDDLIPSQWNYPAMDYTAPNPEQSKGSVTVTDIAKFFVKHIKHDNLARIAVAHRYWADAIGPMGVMDDKCLDLAQLHSKAVDYAKTGVEVIMPSNLRVQRWPHWSEPKNKSRGKIYHSDGVLGRLYDTVILQSFKPAWEQPFDDRILKACQLSKQALQDAKEVKDLYDEAVRRIMAQYGIETEFEVWTTFARKHHQDLNDYKFAEIFGEVRNNLIDEYRALCYTKAGTKAEDKDDEKMKPFLVAIYTVTTNEIRDAVELSKQTVLRGGREIQLQPMTSENMPFMSFPWIFSRELGQIATKGNPRLQHLVPISRTKAAAKDEKAKRAMDLLGVDFVLPPLHEINLDDHQVREGDVLDPFHHDDNVPEQVLSPSILDAPIVERGDGDGVRVQPPTIILAETTNEQKVDMERLKTKCQTSGLPVDSPRSIEDPVLASPGLKQQIDLTDFTIERKAEAAAEDKYGDEDEAGEEVRIEIEQSGLDRIYAKFG